MKTEKYYIDNRDELSKLFNILEDRWSQDSDFYHGSDYFYVAGYDIQNIDYEDKYYIDVLISQKLDKRKREYFTIYPKTFYDKDRRGRVIKHFNNGWSADFLDESFKKLGYKVV